MDFEESNSNGHEISGPSNSHQHVQVMCIIIENLSLRIKVSNIIVCVQESIGVVNQSQLNMPFICQGFPIISCVQGIPPHFSYGLISTSSF